MQVKVQRKSLIDALTQTKEPNVNILGVTLSRSTLLQTLKINNQDDVLNISYGNLSWDAYYEPNEYHNPHVEALKPQPCLQVSLNHTTIRMGNEIKRR